MEILIFKEVPLVNLSVSTERSTEITSSLATVSEYVVLILVALSLFSEIHDSISDLVIFLISGKDTSSSGSAPLEITKVILASFFTLPDSGVCDTTLPLATSKLYSSLNTMPADSISFCLIQAAASFWLLPTKLSTLICGKTKI